MILKLAFLEIWRMRGSLLLQITGFAIALMAMTGGAILGTNSKGGVVPGSGCSDQILELSGSDLSGMTQIGWSPRQAKALLTSLKGTVHAEVMPSFVRVSGANGPQQIGVAFVGPQFFSLTCVKRKDSLGRVMPQDFTDGAVLDDQLYKQLSGSVDLYVEGRTVRPTSFTHGFSGLQTMSLPQLAWFPSAYRWNQGSGFLNFNVNVVHILVRDSRSAPLREIIDRANSTIRDQPTLFKGLKSANAGPALQLDAWTAQRVQMVALLLQLFAAGLFVLMIVNMLTYNFGRLPQSHALASTLSAVGVPPSSLWAFACVEPLVVGSLSLSIGLLLTKPVTLLALMAVTNGASDIDLHSGNIVTSISVAAAVILTAMFIGVRGIVIVRRRTPAKGRAQRLALAWIPKLLSLQVAVAIVMLTLAAQAAVGLLLALPPAPNFPLSGLSVLEISMPGNAATKDNVSVNWNAAWQLHGPKDHRYQMALSQSIAPFLPTIGKFGVASDGTKSVRGSFSAVTPNFFEVLGYQLPLSISEGAWSNTDRDSAPIILSKSMSLALFGGRSPVGVVVRTNRDPTHSITSSDPLSVIKGVFDDGVVGARGAVGRFSLSQLSMQAPIPTAYVPLVGFKGSRLIGFVRHPYDVADAEIVNRVLPAVDALFPGAQVKSVTSAEQMYAAPLNKERSMAGILGIFAVAAFSLGLLGMLALVQILTHCSQTEMAIRYSVGARPREVLSVLARNLFSSLLLGIGPAILVTAGGLYLLGEALDTSKRAGIWGPIVGCILVLAACLWVLTRTVLRVRSVRWMEWLRYE